MDVKETILAEHKTLKRIEELQEFMHGTSMLAFELHEKWHYRTARRKIVFL